MTKTWGDAVNELAEAFRTGKNKYSISPARNPHMPLWGCETYTSAETGQLAELTLLYRPGHFKIEAKDLNGATIVESTLAMVCSNEQLESVWPSYDSDGSGIVQLLRGHVDVIVIDSSDDDEPAGGAALTAEVGRAASAAAHQIASEHAVAAAVAVASAAATRRQAPAKRSHSARMPAAGGDKRPRVTPDIKPPLAEGVAGLVGLLRAGAAGGKDTPFAVANLLIFGTANGNGGIRNMTASDYEYIVIDMPPGFPLPQRDTQEYLLSPPTTFGENSGMINDFYGARVAVSRLLEIPDIHALLTAAYGADFVLADDRGSYRNKPPSADLTESGKAKLAKAAHRDVEVEGGTFKAVPQKDAHDIPTTSVRWGGNQLCVVLLSQNTLHSIGAGGQADGGGEVLGWFMGPLPQAKFNAYKQATVRMFQMEKGKIGTLNDKGDPKKLWMWDQLARLDTKDTRDILFELVVAATIAHGLRPLIHPSTKAIRTPESYAGAVYKRFAGYKPDPTLQTHDAKEQLAWLNSRVREGDLPAAIAEYFARMEEMLGSRHWAADLQTLGCEYLLRVFGCAQATGSTNHAFTDTAAIRR